MTSALKFSLVISAIDSATAPIRRISQAMDQLTATPRAVAASVGRLASNVGLVSVANRATAAGAAFRGVGAEVTRFGLKLGALGGIGGGGLLGLVNRTANISESIALASERVGIGVQQFQRLSFAATQSGVSTEQFSDSMKFLAANAVEAATGSEEAAQWFRAAGVAVKDASGKIKGTDQLFLELSEAFSKSDKSAEKVKVGMALLGRSGADLVPMMNQGAGAIRGLGDEAEKLGLVRSPAAVSAGKEFGDTFAKLTGVIDSVGLAIGDKLIPIISPLVISLTGLVATNRELIATKVGEWATKFSESLPQIGRELTRVSEIASDVISAVRWVGDTFGYAETGAVALGLYLGGPLIGAVANAIVATTALAGSLAAMTLKLAAITIVPAAAAIGNFVTALRAGYGAMAAFNLVLAANPIGLVITGVAALAGVAFLVYDNWEWLSSGLGKLWDSIVGAVSKIDPLMLLGPFGMAARLVIDNWTLVSTFFDDLIGGVIGKFKSLTDVLPDFVKSGLGMKVGVTGPQLGPPVAGGAAGMRGQNFEGELVIRLEGAPRGTRVEQVRSNSPFMDIGVDLGDTMMMP